MGRAVQGAKRKRREQEEPGEGEESRKEQDSEEPKGLCYIGKTSWGKGRKFRGLKGFGWGCWAG